MHGLKMFLFFFILAFSTINAETVYINGDVVSFIEENTYIINDGKRELILIVDKELKIGSRISGIAVRTQYDRDISKPSYRIYDDIPAVPMTLLNILYAVFILLYIFNLLSCIRTDPEKNISGNKYLKVISGPDSGKKFKLTENRLYSIGRDISNDISLNDRTISRKQGELWIVPGSGQIFIKKNDNAKNPIFVNEKRLKRKVSKIFGDDIISIGLTNIAVLKDPEK